MDERTKQTIKNFAFMIVIGIAIISTLAFINSYYGKHDQAVAVIDNSEPETIHSVGYQQIIWGGHSLVDHTTFNSTELCTGENLGMAINISPCKASGFFGQPINHEVAFQWKGSQAKDTTWIFAYSDELKDFNIKLGHYEDTNITVREERWINNYLVDKVVNYTNLGTPTQNSCEFGTENNTRMYRVTRNLQNITTSIYCFTNINIINSTAFRVDGNATLNVQKTQPVLKYTQNVPVVYMGKGLLGAGDNFTYYKVREANFAPNEVIYTLWQYVPKTTRGKWHILGYETAHGLVNSVRDERYIYIDPSWTSDLTAGLQHYYTLNESAGTTAFDVYASLNITSLAGSWVGGLIGNTYQFTGSEHPAMPFKLGDIDGAGDEFSVNLWLYRTGDMSAGGKCVSNGGTGGIGANGQWEIYCYASTIGTYVYDGSLKDTGGCASTLNTWEMITWVYDGSSTGTLYKNGALCGSTVSIPTFNADATANTFFFGGRDTGQNIANARIDELSFYNVSLNSSQISALYNGGSGITYTPAISSSLVTTLNLPANAYVTNQTSVNFSWTITPTSTNITNYTLNIWYSNNSLAYSFQNTTLNLNTATDFSKVATLSQNNYIWGVTGCGYSSLTLTTHCSTTANRTLTIDTTAPSFTLVSLNNVTTISLPVNATINVTSTDNKGLGACQYSTSESGSRVTYTCNTSQIISFASGGAKTITVYANDTAGNSNSSTYSFNIYDFNVTQYENADPIAEGSTSVIYLKINSTSFAIGDADAVITFNSSQFAPTTKSVLDANTILFAYSFPVTSGMGNTTGKTYSYNWTYNTTRLTTRTTPTATQTFIQFAIDDCTVYGQEIANISIKDEEGNSYLTNTTSPKLEIETLVTSKVNPSITWSFAQSFVNRTSIRLCVPLGVLNNTNFTIDMTMGYEANGYVREFFYLDNGTLDNTQFFNSLTPHNITLYDLQSADSTTFLFEFTDENGLEVENAIVHTFRKYIGEGLFREVERSSQDDSGQTHLHLVEEDVIYYFIITQMGRVVYTSSTYNAKCLSTPCTIELSAVDDFTEFPTDWESCNGASCSFTSNKTTRTASLTFSSDSIRTANLSLFKYTDGAIQFINTSSLTATSGTITLSVPASFGNSTYFASVFIDGQFVKSYWVDFKETAQDYFGTTGAILAGLMVLAIVLMAVSEGVGFIVFTIIGVFIVGLMQLIDLSWMALISILCAGGIIIWKLVNRRRAG